MDVEIDDLLSARTEALGLKTHSIRLDPKQLELLNSVKKEIGRENTAELIRRYVTVALETAMLKIRGKTP